MKFVSKLSVIGLIVLMFSFMNVANAADCRGNVVNYCNESKTASDCAFTFRAAAPTMQCAWDSSTSTCRANGSACYGPACYNQSDCQSGYQCTSSTRTGPTACRPVGTSNDSAF